MLIYRATPIFNFAQGRFVFIDALLFVTAYNDFGSLIVAGLISLSVSMVIGAVMHLVLMRPLQGQSIFIMVMVTLIWPRPSSTGSSPSSGASTSTR